MGKQKTKKKKPPPTGDAPSSAPSAASAFFSSLKQKSEHSKALRVWLEVLALVLVLAIGLTVRIEDIRDWRAHPEWALYKGEPLIIENDGYRYLR